MMLREVLKLCRIGRKCHSGNSEQIQKVGALNDINNLALDLDLITTLRTAETATHAVISMAAVATTASTNSQLQIREVRNSNERRRVFEGKLLRLKKI